MAPFGVPGTILLVVIELFLICQLVVPDQSSNRFSPKSRRILTVYSISGEKESLVLAENRRRRNILTTGYGKTFSPRSKPCRRWILLNGTSSSRIVVGRRPNDLWIFRVIADVNDLVLLQQRSPVVLKCRFRNDGVSDLPQNFRPLHVTKRLNRNPSPWQFVMTCDDGLPYCVNFEMKEDAIPVIRGIGRKLLSVAVEERNDDGRLPVSLLFVTTVGVVSVIVILILLTLCISCKKMPKPDLPDDENITSVSMIKKNVSHVGPLTVENVIALEAGNRASQVNGNARGHKRNTSTGSNLDRRLPDPPSSVANATCESDALYAIIPNERLGNHSNDSPFNHGAAGNNGAAVGVESPRKKRTLSRERNGSCKKCENVSSQELLYQKLNTEVDIADEMMMVDESQRTGSTDENLYAVVKDKSEKSSNGGDSAGGGDTCSQQRELRYENADDLINLKQCINKNWPDERKSDFSPNSERHFSPPPPPPPALPPPVGYSRQYSNIDDASTEALYSEVSDDSSSVDADERDVDTKPKHRLSSLTRTEQTLIGGSDVDEQFNEDSSYASLDAAVAPPIPQRNYNPDEAGPVNSTGNVGTVGFPPTVLTNGAVFMDADQLDPRYSQVTARESLASIRERQSSSVAPPPLLPAMYEDDGMYEPIDSNTRPPPLPPPLPPPGGASASAKTRATSEQIGGAIYRPMDNASNNSGSDYYAEINYGSTGGGTPRDASAALYSDIDEVRAGALHAGMVQLQDLAYADADNATTPVTMRSTNFAAHLTNDKRSKRHTIHGDMEHLLRRIAADDDADGNEVGGATELPIYAQIDVNKKKSAATKNDNQQSGRAPGERSNLNRRLSHSYEKLTSYASCPSPPPPCDDPEKCRDVDLATFFPVVSSVPVVFKKSNTGGARPKTMSSSTSSTAAACNNNRFSNRVSAEAGADSDGVLSSDAEFREFDVMESSETSSIDGPYHKLADASSLSMPVTTAATCGESSQFDAGDYATLREVQTELAGAAAQQQQQAAAAQTPPPVVINLPSLDGKIIRKTKIPKGQNDPMFHISNHQLPKNFWVRREHVYEKVDDQEPSSSSLSAAAANESGMYEPISTIGEDGLPVTSL
ncbi:uncharacterized protein LOC141909481 [Tubulanus polymorphus]|uniref:uncharacterized protein LOC141909481 n=1 Tax=Tubulanus polymorphus TaxID=672921 RepID=UPI003DA57936